MMFQIFGVSFTPKNLGKVTTNEELKLWGQLIATIKFALSQKVIQALQSLYDVVIL